MAKWKETVWRCDQCLEIRRERDLEAVAMDPGDDLPPPPWRHISLKGWAGKFAVCCDDCEQALRDRYVRPEEATGLFPVRRVRLEIELAKRLLALCDTPELIAELDKAIREAEG